MLGVDKTMTTHDKSLAAFQRWRSLDISRSTKKAMQVKRAKGEYTGGKAPLGWMVLNGQEVPNDEEQALIEIVRALRTEGLSYSKIARKLTHSHFTTREGNTKFSKSAAKRINDAETVEEREARLKQRQDRETEMNMKLNEPKTYFKELGLLFEKRFIEELKKYHPRVGGTANTDFMYMADAKYDHGPNEFDLIEIKSHKYFPNHSTLDVFETIMNNGIKRARESGVKQGLFHQFNDCIKSNKCGWSIVIAGCYSQSSKELFDLWEVYPDEAWKRYDFYKMLYWNGRKVKWCHLEAGDFWDTFREVSEEWCGDYGIHQALMMLSTTLKEDFTNYSHEGDDTTLLEFYEHLDLNLSPEELQASVDDSLKVDTHISSTPLSLDLPKLIDGVSLTRLDLSIIETCLAQGKDLYETSVQINKSKSYLHAIYSGASTYNHPKYESIRKWMEALMRKGESVNQDELVINRQNEIIIKLQAERKSLQDKVSVQQEEISMIKAENVNLAFQLSVSKDARLNVLSPPSIDRLETTHQEQIMGVKVNHENQIAKLEGDIGDALKMVNRFERIIDNLLKQIEEKS